MSANFYSILSRENSTVARAPDSRPYNILNFCFEAVARALNESSRIPTTKENPYVEAANVFIDCDVSNNRLKFADLQGVRLPINYKL